MTDNEPGGADRVSDGLVVRGRPPFAMTPTSLLRNCDISSHAVRLWSVLASYTYGDRATDRPSRAQLAADVGWKSPRSVDTHLTELRDAGYLTVESRWRPDGGKARNLYILEWEPQDRSANDGTTDPHPVDNSVSACSTHAQNPAHGSATATGSSVDNSIGAGRDHAQDPAHGVTTRGTHAQDPAPTHGQNPAHLGIESTTKKEQPPADLLTTPVRSNLPPTTGPTAPATDLAAQADALVRVIRDQLPDRLRAQLSTAALRTRAEALVRVGWTERELAVAVADRVWNGAHGGAVITWLTDLASVGRPHAAANRDSRTTTLRLRAEAARAKSAAAGLDSPARAAARELAAQLRRRGS